MANDKLDVISIYFINVFAKHNFVKENNVKHLMLFNNFNSVILKYDKTKFNEKFFKDVLSKNGKLLSFNNDQLIAIIKELSKFNFVLNKIDNEPVKIDNLDLIKLTKIDDKNLKLINNDLKESNNGKHSTITFINKNEKNQRITLFINAHSKMQFAHVPIATIPFYVLKIKQGFDKANK